MSEFIDLFPAGMPRAAADDHIQAVNARRVLRTPRPATAAVRPATSLVTASPPASPLVVVVAVAARIATRSVHAA